MIYEVECFKFIGKRVACDKSNILSPSAKPDLRQVRRMDIRIVTLFDSLCYCNPQNDQRMDVRIARRSKSSSRSAYSVIEQSAHRRPYRSALKGLCQETWKMFSI